MNAPQIHIEHFNDLTAIIWHDIAQLRSEVFVVEQDCVYLDLDGKDPIAFHLYSYEGDLLTATLRILPKGEAYSDAIAIGRVVSSPQRRGSGLGHLMMAKAVEYAEMNFPGEMIRLSAQTHLAEFYSTHGFIISGEGYLEDGIPHVPMAKEFNPEKRMAPAELKLTITPHPILGKTLNAIEVQEIDMSESALSDLGLDTSDPRNYEDYIFSYPYRIGGYLEKRSLYRRASHFGVEDQVRDIHLGIDIWAKDGTPLYAPLAGRVFSLYNNDLLGDYGPTLILEHSEDSQSFFSLYGHLSVSSLGLLTEGQEIEAGKLIGYIGAFSENGSWPPHVHVQLIRDLEGNSHDYPGVCAKRDLSWYELNCPDPSLILR